MPRGCAGAYAHSLRQRRHGDNAGYDASPGNHCHLSPANDGGETFSCVGEPIPLPPNTTKGNLHEVHAAELADGKIMTVFYQRYKTDKKTSILYQTWEIVNK